MEILSLVVAGIAAIVAAITLISYKNLNDEFAAFRKEMSEKLFAKSDFDYTENRLNRLADFLGNLQTTSSETQATVREMRDDFANSMTVGREEFNKKIIPISEGLQKLQNEISVIDRVMRERESMLSHLQDNFNHEKTLSKERADLLQSLQNTLVEHIANSGDFVATLKASIAKFWNKFEKKLKELDKDGADCKSTVAEVQTAITVEKEKPKQKKNSRKL
jgi:peptidoglycan hydrolase CwlO-like protein